MPTPASTASPTNTVPPKRRLRLPSFGTQILLGLAFGLLLGWAALAIGPTVDAAGEAADNWLLVALSTIGSTFVTLLKALVPPLIFTAIVASIANLGKLTNAARLAGQTLLWFGITAAASVAIGIGLGLVFQPGHHTSVTEAAAEDPGRSGSWLDFLNGLVPSNFLGLSVNGDRVNFAALQIVVIALVVGIAALRTGKKAKPFLDFNASALAVVQTVLWWIIRLAPLGTLGLIGNAIARYGWELLPQLGTFAIAIYVGLALVVFVVYPIVLRANGLSIRQYFKGAWPAIQLGFVSRSSLGTMPVTQRVIERNFGVPRAYASFASPFGATTKMDGCAAIYPAIAAIFVAQFYGIDLGVTDFVLIAFVSVVGSAATAGLTGALVMLTLTLSTLGLPLAGVGLLLAIDPILDMGRTAVNVAGQALVPAVVAKREGILDQAVYDSPSQAILLADVTAEEEAELEAAEADAADERELQQV
ncbi:dicarboxylate/amino acid:cation symporter [Pseudactinotalea sp. HY158]|uniref:dicarboxylate/amino acid:cation symporter n=1 Tax=Pseudactinotalea sp. HY158 TaxID=2654547 RepID=UPI00129C674B|nr:dicarboxylate/amino acid:cation symporter [Pseudactinotalea sp. HY158]QGH68314.1 cation:dicarboxylase symporter family transporter [Pseudactinotalea sp. HY158]